MPPSRTEDLVPLAASLPGGRGLYEVRFHGRGGQGTVYASVLLAHAAFVEGRGVQAFPFFGVERRGAPVVAHARIGEAPVRIACEVAAPDAVVVMDPTLVTGLGARIAAGLRPEGTLLVNSSRPQVAVAADLGIPGVSVCDASGIARRHGLGSPSNPIVNTAMLGALAGLTGVVAWTSLERAIREHVPARAEANAAAAREAFEAMTRRTPSLEATP